jgi:hypothetical protein
MPSKADLADFRAAPIRDIEGRLARLFRDISEPPVRIAIELPAAVHRDLALYAEALARETGRAAIEPSKLAAPLIARFMGDGRGLRQGEARR